MIITNLQGFTGILNSTLTPKLSGFINKIFFRNDQAVVEWIAELLLKE